MGYVSTLAVIMWVAVQPLLLLTFLMAFQLWGFLFLIIEIAVVYYFNKARRHWRPNKYY